MPLPLLAIGAGLQAGSSILGGFYGSRQKKNEAAIAKYNAAIMRKEASARDKLTKFKLKRQAEEAARIQGDLEAAIGGSGMVSTEGAPMLSLALQKSESDIENWIIGFMGRKEVGQFLSKAAEYTMIASMAKTGARQALIGGFLGAGASAIMSYAAWPKKQSTLTSTTSTGLIEGYGVPSGGAYSYGYGQSWRAGMLGK